MRQPLDAGARWGWGWPLVGGDKTLHTVRVNSYLRTDHILKRQKEEKEKKAGHVRDLYVKFIALLNNATIAATNINGWLDDLRRSRKPSEMSESGPAGNAQFKRGGNQRPVGIWCSWSVLYDGKEKNSKNALRKPTNTMALNQVNFRFCDGH